MSLTQSTKSGVAADLSHDSKYNLPTVDPNGLLHSSGGLGTTGSLADIQVGTEFVLLGRVGIDENSPAASTTYTVQFFDSDAPFKFRINEIVMTMGDITVANFTDGDAGNLDFLVVRGDGDPDGETETDVLASQTFDDDIETGETIRYPHATVFLDNDTVVDGGSLKAQLILDPDATAGATNDGAWVDCLIRCMRVL
jgi:hypothetical protein